MWQPRSGDSLTLDGKRVEDVCSGLRRKKTLDRWQDIVFKICFSDQKYIPGKYDVLLKIYGININIYIYIYIYSFTILHSRYFNFGMFYCTLSSNQAKSGKQVPSKGHHFCQSRSYTEPTWILSLPLSFKVRLKVSHCGFRMWVWVNTYRYHILVGWTSIYQLFWGSLGTRVLTHPHVLGIDTIWLVVQCAHLEKWWSSSMVDGRHPI